MLSPNPIAVKANSLPKTQTALRNKGKQTIFAEIQNLPGHNPVQSALN